MLGSINNNFLALHQGCLTTINSVVIFAYNSLFTKPLSIQGYKNCARLLLEMNLNQNLFWALLYFLRLLMHPFHRAGHIAFYILQDKLSQNWHCGNKGYISIKLTEQGAKWVLSKTKHHMAILGVSCLSASLFPADQGSDRWFGMQVHYWICPHSVPFILEFCQANENNLTNILQCDTIPLCICFINVRSVQLNVRKCYSQLFSFYQRLILALGLILHLILKLAL